MKKAIILRGSPCFGDMIMISWVPRVLKEERGFDYVAVSAWEKNSIIFDNNPYVDEVILFDKIGIKKDFKEIYTKWKHEYNEIIDCRYTVEKKFLKNSSENIQSLETLRKIAKGKNYYKDALSNLELSGKKGELYLSQKEKDRIERYPKRKRILWQLDGSGRNKILIFMPYYITELKKQMPEVEHWVVGSRRTELGEIGSFIKDMREKWTPRESLSHVPIFSLVIGPESFMINTAGAFNIPTLTFFSHSKPENLTKYFKNAHSVEPKCTCYPCYQIRKDWREYTDLEERARAREADKSCLLWHREDKYRALGYKCTIMLDNPEIVKQIINILKEQKNG